MAASVQIRRPKVAVVEVPIQGTAPLIMHKWSEKALKELEGMGGGAVKVRGKRTPQQDFEGATYFLGNGNGRGKKRYGFPAVAFKNAMVRAAKMIDGVTMTDVRQMVSVLPDADDLVEIKGKPQMRTDIVRLKNGSPDVRYRPEFPDWTAKLKIRFNEDWISEEQVVNLAYLAGFSVGIGDWRMEKGGTFGTFEVM